MRLSAVDLPALQIVEIAGVNRNAVSRHFAAFRVPISAWAKLRLTKATLALAEVVDFEAVETKEKTLFLACSNEMASIHTGCPRMPSATLQAIIRDRIELESILHSDGWRGYDGLVDLGYLA